VTAWNSKEAIDRWVRGERENDHRLPLLEAH
jgi:heme-degrading monooxygenase HmoA